MQAGILAKEVPGATQAAQNWTYVAVISTGDSAATGLREKRCTLAEKHLIYKASHIAG